MLKKFKSFDPQDKEDINQLLRMDVVGERDPMQAGKAEAVLGASAVFGGTRNERGGAATYSRSLVKNSSPNEQSR